MKISVIPGQPSDDIKQKIFSLSSFSYDAAAVDRKIQAWEWMFRTPHATPDAPFKTYVIEREGDLVGACLLCPTRVRIGQTEETDYTGYFLNTHPDRRGVGVRLMQTMFRETPFVTALPNDPAHVKIYRRSRPMLSRPLVRHFLPLRPGPLLARRVPVPRQVFWPLDQVYSSLQARRYGKAAGSIDVVEVTRFDTRSDQLWHEVQSGYDVVFKRDADWLNWRYAAFPIFDYRLHYAIGSKGQVLGHLVSAQNRAEGRNQLKIVDLFCRREDTATFAALCQTAVRLGQAASVDVIVALTQAECWTSPAFRAAGFAFSKPAGVLLHSYTGRGLAQANGETCDTFYFTEATTDVDF